MSTSVRRFLSGATLVAAFLAIPSMPAVSRDGASEYTHRNGFENYGRVDRSDGTHRLFFIGGQSLRDDRTTKRTIIMESYSGGRLTSVFVKQQQAGSWRYGAVRPGDPLSSLRDGPHCAGCHEFADTDGMFTRPMLDRFASTGTPPSLFCNRPGRSPCQPAVYEGGASP